MPAQPLGVLSVTDAGQHRETEIAQMQRRRLANTSRGAGDYDSPAIVHTYQNAIGSKTLRIQRGCGAAHIVLRPLD